MFSIHQLLASFCLVTAPVLLAQAEPLQLSYDASLNVVHLQANADAAVLLVVGSRANPIIHINGVDILVTPTHILPLGTMLSGDQLDLPVPAEVDRAGLQLVGVDLAKFSLIASNAVFFDRRDLIDQTFRAALVLTGTGHDLNLNLTAPTSGYRLLADGFDTDEAVTRVWLRLEVPSPGEIVMPVLTPLALTTRLPIVLTRTVEVHMARAVRGTPILPTYKLMAVLDGNPKIAE
jgi:hypothetical protein